MEEQRFKYGIANYRSDKRNPIKDFIASKNEKGRSKIVFCQDMLRERGPELRRPYAAYLRDKIWELRPGINTEEYRMFYFWREKTAVFVHAVDKKDFKQSDIDLSVKRMKMISS